MKPLDKLIFNFLSPVFKEHEDCETLQFNIYSFDTDDSFICIENISINGKYWDQLPDDSLSKKHEQILEGIGLLPDDIEGISEIKNNLQKIANNVWEKACSHPLNKIWMEFWKDENLDKFNKLINKQYLKRFPCRYVEYTTVIVKRNGEITYLPNGEDE